MKRVALAPLPEEEKRKPRQPSETFDVFLQAIIFNLFAGRQLGECRPEVQPLTGEIMKQA